MFGLQLTKKNIFFVSSLTLVFENQNDFLITYFGNRFASSQTLVFENQNDFLITYFGNRFASSQTLVFENQNDFLITYFGNRFASSQKTSISPSVISDNGLFKSLDFCSKY
jgi:hypothetical protein